MKRKIILYITLGSILLTGCSAKEGSTFAKDGKEALENHHYEDAINLLSSALEEDSNDENSRSMYIQARRMMNALKYEENKQYDKAINELELIEGIKGGLTSIKNEASSKKKELEKIYEEEKELEQARKEAAKDTIKKEKYRLQQVALQQAKKKVEEEKKKQEEENKKQEEEENNQEEKNEEDKEKDENKDNQQSSLSESESIIKQ